jgi:acyl-CoA dehydrogenase
MRRSHPERHAKRHIAYHLDEVRAIEAVENKIVDECLQLFGGYGFMEAYPISRM